MTKDLRDKWIAALESGEYAKGSGNLCTISRSNDGEETGRNYCCLGVLCEVMGIQSDTVSDRLTIVKRYDGCGLYLPPDAAIKAGIDLERQRSLARLNDEVDSFAPVVNRIKAMFPERHP